jgi:hypothetical protein
MARGVWIERTAFSGIMESAIAGIPIVRAVVTQ